MCEAGLHFHSSSTSTKTVRKSSRTHTTTNYQHSDITIVDGNEGLVLPLTVISGTTCADVDNLPTPGMRLGRTPWPWEVKNGQFDRIIQILRQVEEQANHSGSNEGPEIMKDCEKIISAMCRRGGHGGMPGAPIFSGHENEGMFYLFVVNFKKCFSPFTFLSISFISRFQRDTRKCIQDGSSDFVKGHGI